MNVPSLVGAVVSSGKATLHEMQTVYNTEDAYDLWEIITVDAHNQRVMDKRKPGEG